MVLRTLLAHYRRHPVQALFLVVSIMLANVLLVGTQLINAQARASYAEGEQVLRANPIGEIRARDVGAAIAEKDYVVLRRQGFRQLAPLSRQLVRTLSGEPVELLGTDPLAIPRSEDVAGPWRAGGQGFTGFASPPFQLWGASARLRQLGWVEGERPETLDGRRLPPVQVAAEAALGHRLLLDIGALQELTDTAGQLSAILVFDMPPDRLAALESALPPRLQFVPAEERLDPAQLTRSFHLNLAAMGLLAFVVGVFLTYNALAFSYTDRREVMRKLRLSGVTRAELRRALLLELCLFLGLGGLVGAWLGAWLARLLLPGVGQTLAQLYGAYISYPDALAPGGAWLSFLMTAAAALLCVAYPLRRSLRAPLLERWASGWQLQEVARRDAGMLAAGTLLLAVAGLVARFAESVLTALTGMAGLLLGAALCLPAILRVLLGALARFAPSARPRLGWLLADSRWLLGPASLALMAMTLALVANSGLNTMIQSFRMATDDWLQQRLAAQLYVRAGGDEAALGAWLAREAPGVSLVKRFRTFAEQEAPAGRAVRVEIVSLQDDTRFLGTVGLLTAARDASARFAQGAGIYVSERAWRLDGWRPGQRVALCPGLDVPVLGIYHDYGNPLSQWMASESLFRSCWPGMTPASMALIGPDALDWAALRERLLDGLGLDQGDVISQAELKATGMAVFDRTFRVTRALNALTLLVAGIGIFCAVSAIHHHRVVQQALLAALGLGRRERGVLLLAQWGLLALLCMVLVWPFGTLLAAYLAKVVTPVAFGWSFALQFEWRHYGTLALLAAACMVLAVAWPALRLLATSPAAMLRQEEL